MRGENPYRRADDDESLVEENSALPLFDIFCPLRHAAQTRIPLAMLQLEMLPSKDCC